MQVVHRAMVGTRQQNLPSNWHEAEAFGVDPQLCTPQCDTGTNDTQSFLRCSHLLEILSAWFLLPARWSMISNERLHFLKSFQACSSQKTCHAKLTRLSPSGMGDGQ